MPCILQVSSFGPVQTECFPFIIEVWLTNSSLGSSPAQASTAPVTQEQEKSKHLHGRHSRRANSINSSINTKGTGEASVSIPATVQNPNIMKLKDMKEPVVRLNRLSEEVILLPSD